MTSAKRSAKSIAERLWEKSLKPWHSDILDMDFLVRERSMLEVAQLTDEAQALQRRATEYAGTPDAPEAREHILLTIRAAIPVMLDPETKAPAFADDEADDLLDWPPEAVNDFLAGAGLGTMTQQAADDAAKNSATTGDANTSSTSPVAAATPPSSPTPMSSPPSSPSDSSTNT